MEVVRKITVKLVNGNKRPAHFPEEDKPGTKRHVMTIIGRVAEAKEASSLLPNGDSSPYIRFRGKFAAWNGEMGEGIEYNSGTAILPNVAGDYLAGALIGEEIQSVDFAFRIGVKKSDSPVGYDYTCEPLIQEAEDADPLKALQAKVRAAQKALPKGKAA